LEREAEEEAERRKNGSSQTGLSKQYGFLDEESMEGVLTNEEIIEKRATEILTTIWGELDARMVTRFTSQNEFFDNNKPYAVELATKELQTSKDNMIQKIVSRYRYIFQVYNNDFVIYLSIHVYM